MGARNEFGFHRLKYDNSTNKDNPSHFSDRFRSDEDKPNNFTSKETEEKILK
jgi:hypothetical protein